MTIPRIQPNVSLKEVKYEIRGPLAKRADELERTGYEIIKLNIGNPGAFGFRAPETLRLALIENLKESEAYCHAKGIFPAREAVVMQQQDRGVMDVSTDDVFIGNGVSELIMLAMRALLNTGDEVLIPSPDYPLWTASVVIHGGKAVHYPCREENGFIPRIEDLRERLTDRTKGIVVINPNNPTGVVYDRATLEQIVRFAEENHLVVFSDEIYDQMLYDDAEFVPMATLVKNTLCATFAGLSKVYRACGLRVGWLVFTGERKHAKDYIGAIEFLASLRLCSNVPGQWAVQTALGGFQTIGQLTAPGGRLFESRAAVLEGIAKSEFLKVVVPMGAMYAFPRIDTERLPQFDDEEFAMDLLERKHVLVVPGNSFNVPYRDHFRLTTLPDEKTIKDVFGRMEELLDDYTKL